MHTDGGGFPCSTKATARKALPLLSVTVGSSLRADGKLLFLACARIPFHPQFLTISGGGRSAARRVHLMKKAKEC
jgi:hypothetical protein